MTIKRKNTQFLKTTFDTTKYPDFEETKNILQDTDYTDYRNAYANHNDGKKFPLTDDHIAAMISVTGDDSYDEEVFGLAMQYMVEGKDPRDAIQTAILDFSDEGEQHPEDTDDPPFDVEEENEEQIKPVEDPVVAGTRKSLSINLSQSARRMAEKIKDDTALRKDLHQIMVAPSTLKRGDVVMLHHLHKKYSNMADDGRIVESELDSFPIVGSEYDPSKGNNQVFDKYEYTPDNGGEKIKGSWSEDFYLTFPEAANIMDEIVLVEAALSKDVATPEKYKDPEWTDTRLKNWKNTLKNSRYASGLKKFRNAIALHHKIKEVETKCDRLTVHFDYVRDHKTDLPVRREDRSFVLRDSDLVIYVAPRGRAGEANYYTVQQFLKVKPDLAAKNGGTMGALKETIAKAPSPKGKQKKDVSELYPEIKDMDSLELSFSNVGNFFDKVQTTEQKREIKALFAKKLIGEGRKDWVMLLGSVFEGITSVFTEDLKKEYQNYLEEEAKQENERMHSRAA